MAIYYNLQGDANYEAGKYKESLFYYQQCLNIYNLNPSTLNSDLALSYNNIASVYLKLKDYNYSLEFYQKALEQYEEIYGKEHIVTANVWNNMGLILESVSDHKNSLSCFIKSLKIKKHVLEGKDLNIALGYYNIGKSYDYLNYYDKAEKFYLKSLAIFKVNELCLEYATALLSFGLLNDKLGRLKEAVEYYDECIWISQKLSVDNILSASAYNYLGLVLIKADLFDEAINNFNSAINIRLKLQGKLNFETASLYNNIACAYFKKEDYDQALLNYTNFINIFIELNQGNEVNDETATAYNNMGLVYVKKKEFELAVDCFSYSIKIKKQLERETDQETISIMNNLAGVYFKLKQFVNSLNIYLEIYKTTSSSSSLEEENYNILKYIGHCFLNLDDYNSAIPYYEKGLETSIALYGEVSFKTSDCYLNLGIAYQNINQIESSLKMLKTCYEIRKSILEETDYNVIVVLSMIQKLENVEEN
jgi:tetratricopeptide (TPR) repeat protein